MRLNHFLAVFSFAFVMLLGYQFIEADWTAPTGTPPANNVATPLNVSATLQSKAGDLVANIFAAVTEMRTNRYCDAVGANCFTHAQMVNIINNTPTSTAPTCTYEVISVVGCGGAPACPAGYTAVGGPSRNPASCGVGNNPKDTYTQSCGRNVCR